MDALLHAAARSDNLVQRPIEQIKRMPHTGKEKRLFILIILIDHAHADAGLFSYTRNGRGLKAAAGKFLDPGFQDRIQRRLIQFLVHTFSHLT